MARGAAATRLRKVHAVLIQGSRSLNKHVKLGHQPMNAIDSNNAFALISAAASTAEAIAADTRQTSTDRAVAARAAALKVWKPATFSFREWTPAAPAKTEVPTA
jgi:hypothetical protein